MSCIQTDPDNPEELILKNVTHSDEGWYTCIAANSLGTTAAKAYLKVVDGNASKNKFYLLHFNPFF